MSLRDIRLLGRDKPENGSCISVDNRYNRTRRNFPITIMLE